MPRPGDTKNAVRPRTRTLSQKIFQLQAMCHSRVATCCMGEQSSAASETAAASGPYQSSTPLNGVPAVHNASA